MRHNIVVRNIMCKYLFSYKNYEILCRLILETGRLCDYSDIIVKKPDEFIILRHDVEFSPNRAFELSLVENKLGIKSTYFFQVRNNAYNILSQKNKDLLLRIMDSGHHIGLHFHLNGLTNLDKISEEVSYESDLLSHYLNTTIERFSFHRPPAFVLKENLKIKGVINAYAPEFFTYSETVDKLTKQDVKYIADSKNEWQYTDPFPGPTKQLFETYKKMQILCHPYTWTETGYPTFDNLNTLIEEERSEFVQTLMTETSYVKEYLNAL